MWLISVLVVIMVLLYKFVRPLRHWKEKGVPHVRPWPFFTNMATITFRKRAYPYFLQDLYNAYPTERYTGLFEFTTPVLMFRDLHLINQISIKDFETFPDRQPFLPEDVDPFWNKNLMALSEEKWRALRSTLSPAFTSSKMRAMFNLMRDSAHQFTRHFLQKGGTEAAEMKDVFTRFTNDVTASTIFGVTCDSLENGDNEFYLTVKQASNWSGIKRLKLYGFSLCPTLMKLFKVTFFEENVKQFFQEIVTKTIRLREEQNIARPDMIHLLMEARKESLKHDNSNNKRITDTDITDEDITAQALIFFLGGFDTSSTLMSFLAYELAMNPDIQWRLIREVDYILKIAGGEVSYDALLQMGYLDMVVRETLRKWPPSILCSRISKKAYTLKPQGDNERLTHLEKGTVTWIPIFPIHRDPKYYPEPDIFDPERFSEDNKRKIEPFAYLPFGVGPRNCIGSRFALLKVKIIMFYLLAEFELVPVAKTEIPLTLSKNGKNLQSARGIWLGFKPRTRKTC